MKTGNEVIVETSGNGALCSLRLTVGEEYVLSGICRLLHLTCEIEVRVLNMLDGLHFESLSFTGATCRAGSAHPSGSPKIPHVLWDTLKKKKIKNFISNILSQCLYQ